MKLVTNSGTDRVIDLVRPHLQPGNQLGCVTPSFSLFAYAELRGALVPLERVQLILPPADDAQEFLGGEGDRAQRNQLQARWLANQCAQWMSTKVELRRALGRVPQGAVVMRNAQGAAEQVVLGSFAFSTDGLGLTPGNPLNLIQASETGAEAAQLAQWFDHQWAALHTQPESLDALVAALRSMGTHRAPFTVYALILHCLFGDRGDELDEERIVKSATGIRNTVVWKKLFKFQRDGVVGAIDKLARFGGCIIADSVGLGKTFEALAIIKYHELRNDRVLVLAPKRLRDNWTLYKANDQRNVLAADRFNYDVLNHTDLSRDGGHSGDIDLSYVNWGNYDLVVIDESHNFRNKASNKGKESRYDRLMRKIIQEGVKTRVLMLSATPVNNRLADLKNQIAFITEGDDTALAEHGIASIEQTTRKAQIQFNRWLERDEAERTPAQLVEMLGFDYFTLLDHLTIARSRRHVERYYGTDETGKFPDRLAPINIKADVDLAGQFRAIKDINLEIRRLNLASYAPLRYVLPHKQAAYDAKYSTQIRGGESFFRQTDREESLIHLLRVNVLKRMESAVSSFALTVQRQLKDVESVLAHIENHDESIEELHIADIDIEDPAFEALLVGRKVKVLLCDVDLLRWKQDLIEDRNRLATLLAAAQQVTAERDAKLAQLRTMIEEKCRQPINVGNRKIIVFTAFSDTAQYLYAHLAPWAKASLGVDTALVTGSAGIQTTLPGLRKNMASVLSAFAPRAKERPADLGHEGEIDLLIATDCISEGQNLQDCDWLVNYDTDADEKYGLNWHGKRRARQLALTPSTGTLRPCPDESVDWDTTQNLMIEGDNLEVLKLLQKSYAGKVKLIYIDPPYNTGKDFVYPDNFQDNIKNYLEITGQTEGGAKVSSNTEASGRFHTDWLNMMYPRIKLARNLMCDDGVLIASIDEKELQNLRYVCNEVFGEECFVAVITVLCNPKGRSQDKHFATNHEYIVVYSKTQLPKGYFSIAKNEDQIEAEYPEEDDGGKYRLLELRNTHREFGKHNRKNLHFPMFSNDDGELSLEAENGLYKILPNWEDGFEGCWTWEKKKVEKDIDLLVAKKVSGQWKVYRKSYANGAERMLKTILIDKDFYTEKGQKEFNKLFETKAKIFQSPKSPQLLAQLFQAVTKDSDVILDFFAGSGTTGHAVMEQNIIDGFNRKYILVQLPEKIDVSNGDQKIAAVYCDQLGKPRTIAELTKERLRRAATKIRATTAIQTGSTSQLGLEDAFQPPAPAPDLGFRVFKLDHSNIRAWNPQPVDLEQAVIDYQDHLLAGRSESDILYELLLKLGLDLCVPIATRQLVGLDVHAVGGGVLLACLAPAITSADVEALAQGIIAWHQELAPAGESTCVFRDSAFEDDVAKTNLTAILAQSGIENVRSL